MKTAAQPLSPQHQAMVTAAQAALSLAEAAGARGVVLLIDWGNDRGGVIASVSDAVEDRGAEFVRLIASAPERVDNWSRLLLAGGGMAFDRQPE